MKLVLLFTGKTVEEYTRKAVDVYLDRLKHYVPVQVEILPDIKASPHLSAEQVKAKEAGAILSWVKPENTVVLLDERGVEQSSEQFAAWLQKKMNSGSRQLVLVIGGPYGFDSSVYEAVSERISLSKMTFSHQMVRVFLTEQLYRAMTILHNEPYHHA